MAGTRAVVVAVSSAFAAAVATAIQRLAYGFRFFSQLVWLCFSGSGIAAAAMLKYIDARHNIVRCNVKCGVSPEALEKISSQSCDAIVAMLGQTKLSDVEVAEATGIC